MTNHRSSRWLFALAASGCVPSGNAGQQDAGTTAATAHTLIPPPGSVVASPAEEALRRAFQDDFERPGSAAPDIGPDWVTTAAPGIWHIESRREGRRLCGEHARNHGIWLKHPLPVNARVEFDAVSDVADGDLKAEFWGDGRSYATSLSYTNASSYLTIFGGWHNKYHVLARLNEHGNDRQEIAVDPTSDDPREKPVMAGQNYHFKVERTDGKIVRWWIDGNEMLSYPDSAPLVGAGHDHFGFNDWDVKVCFDNVRIVPLP